MMQKFENQIKTAKEKSEEDETIKDEDSISYYNRKYTKETKL